MTELPAYPIASVTSVGVQKRAGAEVGVRGAWTDGEEFMLLLSADNAHRLMLGLQDALSDAARMGANRIAPVLAEALVRQASPVPGQEILTVRLEGGAQLQMQIPAGRYDRGIPRAPDA
jgi:hypothetical protein